MEVTWRIISGEGDGENGRKGTGNKKHNTHGHELRGGMLKGSRGQCREEGDKGETNMGQQ